jgi:hypothetical protein
MANRCYNCGSTAHFARFCPHAKQQNQGQGASQQNRSKGKKQMVQVRQGGINYTILTELLEEALVMMGIFSIYNKAAVILFDSGASHSFISGKFGAKVGLDFYHTKGSYMISTPGGKIASNQIIFLLPSCFGFRVVAPLYSAKPYGSPSCLPSGYVQDFNRSLLILYVRLQVHDFHQNLFLEDSQVLFKLRHMEDIVYV